MAAQRGDRNAGDDATSAVGHARTELRKLDKPVNDAEFLFAQPIKGVA